MGYSIGENGCGHILWGGGGGFDGKEVKEGGKGGGDMYKAIAIQVEPRIKKIHLVIFMITLTRKPRNYVEV